MKRNARNKSRGANRLFSHLAAEKKKSVLALCMISLMAFMWIKVLSGKGPQKAAARVIGQLPGQSQLQKTEPDREKIFCRSRDAGCP